MKDSNIKTIVQNKRAYHDFFIDETYECGIALVGTEIKALRVGKASLQDSFCYIKQGEMFINGLNISKYEMGNIFNHEPTRTRKLLLHKLEITRLTSKLAKDGYTLIPLKIYLKDGLAKVEIGLAKGKKLYDKREDIKKKDQEMQIKKVLGDN